MSAVVRALLLVASLAAVRAQRCADDYAPSAAQEPAIARLPFYQSFEDIDRCAAACEWAVWRLGLCCGAAVGGAPAVGAPGGGARRHFLFFFFFSVVKKAFCSFSFLFFRFFF